MSNKKITTSKTLEEYEGLFMEHGFFRTHQSNLINLSYVKEYLKGDRGSVLMKNGDVLGVAKNRKQKFVQQST